MKLGLPQSPRRAGTPGNDSKNGVAVAATAKRKESGGGHEA